MYAIAYSSCMTVVYIYQDLILAHHSSPHLVIHENVKSAGMLTGNAQTKLFHYMMYSASAKG